jgi:hypothetical protein
MVLILSPSMMLRGHRLSNRAARDWLRAGQRKISALRRSRTAASLTEAVLGAMFGDWRFHSARVAELSGY